MELIYIAQAFRGALESQEKLDALPFHMKNFPRGCCGVVSELLGEYLNTEQGMNAEYVCGVRDGASHAWLEQGDLVIDITSDQFDGRPSVFVDAKDDWYRSWDEDVRHAARHESGAWTFREERALFGVLLQVAGLPQKN